MVLRPAALRTLSESTREGRPAGLVLSDSPSRSFSTALSQLANAHAQEIAELNKEHSQEREGLKDEIRELREHLRRVKDTAKVSTTSTAAPLEIQDSQTSESDDSRCMGGCESPCERVIKACSIDIEDINPGEGFGVKDVWKKNIDRHTWGEDIDTFLQSYSRRKANSVRLRGQEEALVVKKYMCQTVICPNGNFRLTWDIFGLVLITFDLLTLPFVLAFQPADTLFSQSMEWISLLFWTGDMIQGFFLGYYEQGQYIDDHKKILKHYLKTWFVIDALVVWPEWLLHMAGSLMSGAGNVNQFMKVLKGTRAVRVLRLLKLQRIMNVLYDMIESEWTFIVLTLARMLLFVLVLNHVIACLWFFIGRCSMESQITNWIEVGNVDGKDLAYMYTTSLHWSLTQFTPASMDISARNVWERIFSIIVLFFAMVTFSSIVASITGSMTSLRNMRADDMKQFWLLRRYLRQRKVTNDLSNRIFKFLEHHLKVQSSQVQAPNVKILSGLSEALRNEMTHQMHSPQIIGHPFFARLSATMNQIMHRVCSYALKPQVYAEQEPVFAWGDEGKRMYFVKGGELEYKIMDGTKLNPPIQAREWISEAVLWVPWRHQGDLLAISTVDLLVLNPVTFAEHMGGHPRSWVYAKKYALTFASLLNSLERSHLTDVIRETEFFEEAARVAEQTQDDNTSDYDGEDSEGPSGSEEMSSREQAVAAAAKRISHHSMNNVPSKPGQQHVTWEDRRINSFFRRCRETFGF